MRNSGVVDVSLRGTTRFDDDPGVLVAGAWTALFLGAAADLLVTQIGLQMGLYETNPVARYVIGQSGFLGMVALKGASIGVVSLGAAIVWCLADDLSLYVPIGVGAIWATAGLWNAALLLAGVVA